MSSMKVLVIGAGGREHALAWKLAASNRVAEVLVAPGNAGTAMETKCRNVDVAPEDVPGLLALAKTEGVGFVVVGPEAPLALGVVDAFQAAGIRIFGPTQAAAQLESSKAFTKAFLKRHQIPTAEYEVFTEVTPALEYIRSRGAPIVVKADGLAAGKGVVVAVTVEEAVEAVESMLSGNKLGAAGSSVVIEDFLEGEEASFIVVANGSSYVSLATSQDHKRIFDGDKGPNTGGMGAYSPAPVIDDAMLEKISRDIVEPTLAGMIEEGNSFCGFLYAGLMIDSNGGIRVLEYNTRLGDPETQPILYRLESDLLELLEAAVNGDLEGQTQQWASEPAVGVVLAAQGYPASARKGDVISGLDDLPQGVKVFHAGTKPAESGVVTSGGRVLCVVAKGANVSKARELAYEGVRQIQWDGVQYRSDIGYRAVARGL